MAKASEHGEQVMFIKAFEERWPEHRILSIPNGARTNSIQQATKLKREGLRAGVPDLFIPALNVWIEMKTLKGKVSADQRDWIEYLESIDHHVIVGYGARDAYSKLLQFMYE
jgi:hypothetical protein